MYQLIVSLLIVLETVLTSEAQSKFPDLLKSEDLKALGTGTIVENDNSIIRKVALLEVREYWIVYIKNESLHDLLMEKILRIEFLNSEWGPLRLSFKNNKPEISRLYTY